MLGLCESAAAQLTGEAKSKVASARVPPVTR